MKICYNIAIIYRSSLNKENQNGLLNLKSNIDEPKNEIDNQILRDDSYEIHESTDNEIEEDNDSVFEGLRAKFSFNLICILSTF